MANCLNDSVGVRALNDLGAHTYQGREGGLYPGGVNKAPDVHQTAGVGIAATVQALNISGQPDPNGKVGFVSIGFSTTKRTFDQLVLQLAADSSIKAGLKAVNCAFSGVGAPRLANLADPYWTTNVPALLAAGGLTKDQVQVIWLLTGQLIKQQDWPDHVSTLADNVAAAVRNCKTYFPNLKLCYLSSFNYLGYAESTTQAAPEPHYFEQGFAIRDVIERQMAGDPSLNFDPAAGTVNAPWVKWLGYCWTDGATPRVDGADWLCPDVVTDGIHAAPQTGAPKLARLLLEEMKGDATCQPWLLTTQPSCNCPASVRTFGDAVAGASGAPLLSVSGLPVAGKTSIMLRARQLRPGACGYFLVGTEEAALPFAGGHLYIEPAGWAVQPFTVDSSGMVELDFADVPPTACGDRAYAQVVMIDDTASGGMALSEGLELTSGN